MYDRACDCMMCACVSQGCAYVARTQNGAGRAAPSHCNIPNSHRLTRPLGQARAQPRRPQAAVCREPGPAWVCERPHSPVHEGAGGPAANQPPCVHEVQLRAAEEEGCVDVWAWCGARVGVSLSLLGLRTAVWRSVVGCCVAKVGLTARRQEAEEARRQVHKIPHE